MMKTRITLILFLLSFFSIVSVFAQTVKKEEKPNFNGIWILDESKSVVNESSENVSEKNEESICSYKLIINHKEPKLGIKDTLYCYKKNNPQKKWSIEVGDSLFYTDYRGEKNNVPDNFILSTKTKWSEGKIIIRNRLDNSIEEYLLSNNDKCITRNQYFTSNANQ